MSTKSFIHWPLSAAIAIFAFTGQTAAAAEIAYDTTTCYQGHATLVHRSDALTVLRYDLTGIVQSNIDDKSADGGAMHCIGTAKIAGQESDWHSYCRFVRPNGDEIIGEYQRSAGSKTGSWTALAGTGQFAGISGGGTVETALRGKALKRGQINTCTRGIGSYTVPD